VRMRSNSSAKSTLASQNKKEQEGHPGLLMTFLLSSAKYLLSDKFKEKSS